MEFNNANPQYRPASKTPYIFIQKPSRNDEQLINPYGTVPVQPNTPQPQYLSHTTGSNQATSTWPVAQSAKNDIAAGASPNHSTGSGSGSSVDVQNMPSSRSSTMTGQVYPNNSWPNTSSSGDYYSVPILDTNSWCQKACVEIDYPNVDSDMSEFNPGLMGNDEDCPVIDLRQYGALRPDARTSNYATNPRRFSENSGPMQSAGLVPDTSTYEEFSESETVSYAASDYEWGSFDPPPNLLSPLASPGKQDHARPGNRSRTSPGASPHHSYNNARTSPYTIDSSRLKRWSTGAAPTSIPTTASSVRQGQERLATYGQRLNPHHSLPTYPTYQPNTIVSHPQQSQYVLSSQPHGLPSNHTPFFRSADQRFQMELPRPVPSQGMYRLLQSNDHQHPGCSTHYADFSDPPDLYSSLHEEPCDPPEEDMNPSDPDMVPKEQELRFAGDLYTPKWVRGHGNKREGWCGLCKPGRWLVLKNSAFWYDKSFTHGVSWATGAAFQEPQETRRTEGNLDVWEGLCSSCGGWIPLVSSKKKGTTWFRHAYKCHTHPKVKDGNKRRRDISQQVRARTVSNDSITSPSRPSSYPGTGTVIKREHASGVAFMPEADSTGSSTRSTPCTRWPPSDAKLVGIPRSESKGGFDGWAGVV